MMDWTQAVHITFLIKFDIIKHASCALPSSINLRAGKRPTDLPVPDVKHRSATGILEGITDVLNRIQIAVHRRL